MQEPEEGKETMETPMVPGLRPPSPRPMLHDPLDRAETEPQLTSAELERFVTRFLHAWAAAPIVILGMQVLETECKEQSCGGR